MVNENKIITIAIFGNRFVVNHGVAGEKLYNYLKLKLEHGAVRVLVGTHGDFDNISLRVCKQLKNEGFDIHISLIFTSQKRLIKELEMDKFIGYYKNVETMMYDIEDVHYKNQIVVSNRNMVNDSNEVIVYYRNINSIYSGVNRVIKYAKSQGKLTTNLFSQNDIDKFR